jgi:hypothetical protein
MEFSIHPINSSRDFAEIRLVKKGKAIPVTGHGDA